MRIKLFFTFLSSILFFASCEDRTESVEVHLNNPINRFAFDDDGNKWYGNINGLYFINNNNLSKVETGISSIEINCLVLHDGSLWAGTNAGVVKFTIEENNKVSVASTFDTSNCAIASNTVYTIGFDNLNRIWVGTSKGISMYDGSVWIKNKEIRNGLVVFSGTDVTNIAFRKNVNDCHFSTNGKSMGHIKFSPETDAVSGASQMIGGGEIEGTNYNGDYTTDTIYCVFAGSDSLIWFGSQKGLTSNKGSNHEGSEGTYFNYYLAGEKVFAGIETSEGKIWAGTNNGLYLKSGNIWINYNTTNGLNSNIIRSISEGIDKSIWIETDKGVSQFANNAIVNYILQ